MTDDELVVKMADAIGDVWDCEEEDDDRLRVYARAALAVAKPVIRDEALEEAAVIVAGDVYQEHYRTWPSLGDGNRRKDSEQVKACDALASAIRSLKTGYA